MKKILILFTLLLLLFTFGCNKEDGKDKDPKEELKLVDYYPVLENTRYYYKGDGNEYAEYSSFIDYTLNDRFQTRVDNPGTSVARIYELKDGVLKVLLNKGESYAREDYLRNPSLAGELTEDILIKEPLEKGNSWTLANGNKREITGTDIKVTVPLGEFKTIEVTTTDKSGITKDYYAKDIGLVQSKFIAGKDEISSSLEKIEKNTPYKTQVNFYYPHLDQDKYYFVNATVAFNTNDITRQVLETAYKTNYTDSMKNQGIGNVLTANTKIMSLYLDKFETIHLDLNNAFITEMSAGAYYETMLLTSLVNTFGAYYGREKVILTIGGDNYSSGHIYLQDGEFLKPDYSKEVKFN